MTFGEEVVTPREFLEQIVEPNLADVNTDFGNIRLVLNLVYSVDALAAQIFHAAAGALPGKDDSEYREILAKANPEEFALLRDVAKAIKHVRLQRGKPLVSGSDQLSVRALGWDEVEWNDGRWDSPPQVVVETTTGRIRVVETIAMRSLHLLKAEMVKAGL